jgi:ubiquitin-conjugating enzyme E2 variant
METLPTVLTDLAWVAGCLFVADLLTGLMHWAEDTWLAPGRSEFLDRYIVRDNIEHHRRPGSIRAGTYWETNRVTIVLSAIAVAGCAIGHVVAWQPYLMMLLLSHSNQVHKWAHSSNVPAVVRWMQSFGLLQSPAQHARHHKNPYATNYCAITNFVNPALDASGFWRGLEWTIERFGLRVVRATEVRGGY